MIEFNSIAFWRRPGARTSHPLVQAEITPVPDNGIIPEGLAPNQRVRLANLNAADLTKSEPTIQENFLANPDIIPEDVLSQGFFRLGLVAVEIAEGKLTREEGLSELIAMETKLNEAIKYGNRNAIRAYKAAFRLLTNRGLRKIGTI